MPTGEIKALYFSDGVVVTAGVAAPIGVGGFGTSFQWFSPGGVGAIQIEEFGHRIYQFPDNDPCQLWGYFIVPNGYVTGSQLNLDVLVYSPSTSNTIKLKGTSYLVQKDVTAVSSQVNSYASTNSALTNATTANRMRKTSIDVTDATGKINSVAIAAGDEIKVLLQRDYATDTDTDFIRLLADATIMRFGT